MKETAGEFWGELSGEYDEIIRKLVSPYPAMLWALFYYLPKDFAPSRILELGCGTGNLTSAIRKQWPNCEIVVVDAAQQMLEKTTQRVGSKLLAPIHSKFEELNFEPKSFDYITSSLALHHLPTANFKLFLESCYSWLKPGGFYGILDCVRADASRLYERANEYWIELAKKHGLSDMEMQEQINHHQAHDHYPVVIDLACWLRDTGFEEVDILWRHCIWAVLQGRKPMKS